MDASAASSVEGCSAAAFATAEAGFLLAVLAVDFLAAVLAVPVFLAVLFFAAVFLAVVVFLAAGLSDASVWTVSDIG